MDQRFKFGIDYASFDTVFFKEFQEDTEILK
jgi:hypothetical protein